LSPDPNRHLATVFDVLVEDFNRNRVTLTADTTLADLGFDFFDSVEVVVTLEERTFCDLGALDLGDTGLTLGALAQALDAATPGALDSI